MAVTVSTDGEFSHGVPQPLFRDKGLAIGLTDVATYDVSRDGQRFLVVDEADAARAWPRPAGSSLSRTGWRS